MSDSWDDRRRAQEDSYFEHVNKQAMQRLAKRDSSDKGKVRPSPITGKPMEQKTVMGVVVDVCPDTKGIWLDAGELEQILAHAASEKGGKDWLSNFVNKIIG